MNENFDGLLAHDMAIFGDPYKAAYSACGFAIVAPVLTNSSIAFLNQYEAELRSMLRMLKLGTRMQVAWNLESDCSHVLLHYYDQTNAAKLSSFEKRERHERFARFSKRMDAGHLRFERVCVYFSRPMSLKGDDSEQLLKAESESFHLVENELLNCFQRLGGKVERLKTDQLFAEQFRFCNPAQTHIPDYDPSQNLMGNCLTSEGNAVASTDSGFFMDGYFFGFVVLSNLPQATCSGLIQILTELPICDFGITVNVIPLDTNREIEKEEAEIDKIKRSLKNGGQQRSITVLNEREQRVRRLASNEDIPFQMQMIIRAWDESHQGLQIRLGEIKSAITRMQMAKFFSLSFPTSARNYFRASFPGWCWDQCQDFCHLIEDAPLSNLLPISGSPSLGNAEALYDGANGNLIGVNSFINGAPQHAIVLGKTGSGKSALLIDLLSQTSPNYSLTVIVDNGLSYQTYCQVCDPKMMSMVIKPNSSSTLNYFDTGREPLCPENLADMVAVAHQMAGTRPDQDSDRMRHAVLLRCIHDFLLDFADDWISGESGRREEVAKYAIILERIDSGGLTLIERHRHFIQWAKTSRDLAQESYEGIKVEECWRVPTDSIRQLAFVFICPKEAATHGGFQQWLEMESMGDASDRDEVGILATLLKPWCADGGLYGAIFDGVNNVSLKGEIVHIEMGQIPESAADLRNLAALVITNQIRNAILRLPRNQRKRVVFEELGSLLAIPGGAKIVREFFETMRKYNCWVVGVVQQLGILKECGASLLGNIRMAFLLKQSSIAEVEILADAFELPYSARETLLRFPEPSRERGAPFLIWKSGGSFPEIVIGYHIASREMLYVSSSSGEDFEKRKEALSKYDDMLDGIIAESSK